MARSYTYISAVLFVTITLMAGIVHAQANRPLNVSSDTPRTSSDEAISKDEMIRRAREMAQQAEAAQRRATTPTSPAATSSSSTSPATSTTSTTSTTNTLPWLAPEPTPTSNQRAQNSATVGSSVSADNQPLHQQPAGPGGNAAQIANDAAASAVAPPVMPLDPNESKPLGPSNADQLGNSDLQASGSTWGVTKTILALAFVVGLILVGRQLMLRWTGQPAVVNKSRAVEVLSRVSVGPRQHVVLLRMGERILVVVDSAGQMRPLANIDEPEEVAAILKSVTSSRPTSISQGFSQMLGRFDQEYDEQDDRLRIREEGQDTAEFQVDKTRDQINGLLARVKAMAGKGGA